MEHKPKSQAELRKEQFLANAARARELGQRAIESVDAVLREDEEIMAGLKQGVEAEIITEREADEWLFAYRNTRMRAD